MQGNQTQGLVPIRTLFVIILTSFLTVMFTFLGHSAINISTASVHSGKIQNLQPVTRKLNDDYDHEFVTPEPLRHKYTETGNEYSQKVPVTHAPSEKCIKRLPQAIIVGIQKCGTTALLKFLEAHPQIVACLDPQEVQYFNAHYNKPLDWYKNLMPCSYSNQITMEKSPPYFYRPFCAERIKKMDPNTKIIVIVKDPITRAESMYAMLNEYGEVNGKSFEDAVTVGNKSIVNATSRFVDFSNYPKHMKPWLHNFDRKNILVMDGHNFETEPAQELGVIENFLGIENYFTPSVFAFNATKGKYCIVSDVGDICLSAKKGRKHPTYSPKVRQLLEQYFHSQNEEFFKMINRRFDWGY